MRSRQERKSCQRKWWVMHTEKSRYCAREFATFKDPSVFAAASDVDNTSLVDLLAVKRGHSIMCFDAVAAIGQAPETELNFHRSSRGAQSSCGTACVVAIFESERMWTQKEQELGKIISLKHCCRKLPMIFQTESEATDNLLLK